MKRLSLLVVGALMALVLSACGNKEEKKVETGAQTGVEQTAPATSETPANTTTEQPAAEQPASSGESSSTDSQ